MDKTGDQLKQLEEALLSDLVRKDPQALDVLLADEFREFGTYGREYSKAEVIREMSAAVPGSRRLENFEVQPLTADAALVTYRAVKETPGSPPLVSLRSSIWIQRNGNWQMLFHQGTIEAV